MASRLPRCSRCAIIGKSPRLAIASAPITKKFTVVCSTVRALAMRAAPTCLSVDELSFGPSARSQGLAPKSHYDVTDCVGGIGVGTYCDVATAPLREQGRELFRLPTEC